MSQALTVLTKHTEDPSVCEVFWASGLHTQGVITVSVSDRLQDKDLVAELYATQHLLEVLEVCSKDRTGNSLTITCSLGAVRKLASGRSSKEHLAPFALFLRTRFVDAEIAISKSETFIRPSAYSNRSSLGVTSPRPSSVALPSGELAGVTAHALEQFRIRFSFARSCDAWRELRSCAAHSATLASRSTAQERMEYGASVRAYDCFNGARLIVVDDGVFPMIVTAYWHYRAQGNYQKLCQTVA